MNSTPGTYDEWIAAYRASLAPRSTFGMCGAAVKAMRLDFPELRAVRGHVFDAVWGQRAHWWLVTAEGAIVDPTADQFPALVDYEEYADGQPVRIGTCANCGGPINAYTMQDAERRAGCETVCSDECSRSYGAYLVSGNPF